MCQKSLKNDLGIIIDNIQLLKHLFDVFFHIKNAIFRKKNLKIFGFSQNVPLHRGRGGCGNLNFSQKVAITPRVWGLRLPCQKFDSGEPHIEKISK